MLVASLLTTLPASPGVVIAGPITIVNISVQSTQNQIDFVDSNGGGGATPHVVSIPAGFVGIVQVNRRVAQGLYAVNIDDSVNGSVGTA
jgi:hypothetical protein